MDATRSEGRERAAVLSVAEMYRADALAMAEGIGGPALMEAAGWAVARAVRRRFPPCRVAVLCGPGNNGGDGFVAARFLSRWGYRVRLALLGERAALKGDAAAMAALWRGAVEPLSPAVLERADMVVDALFGAGLARPLAGAAAEAVEAVVRQDLPVVAVDVPSGVEGDTGAVRGIAPRAVASVTFFRKKPGHLLLPGRLYCGAVTVADIGIPSGVLERIAPAIWENGPALWRDALVWPSPEGHKYRRGHLLIAGGGAMTGAARLAALAARRAGAGLVSVAAPAAALPVYRGDAPGVIVLDRADWPALIADGRRNAVLVGPGCGVGEDTRGLVLAALAEGRAMVLDADALTAFAGRSGDLFAGLSSQVVLTPHDGEFARLFPDLSGSRLERARAAAARAGAVVLLKGADTVVAHPDGRATINGDASPWLATAGSGDVLAGIIGGLLAQGLDGFAAAAAGAWMHAAAVPRGPGLIAEDLAAELPTVLAALAPRTVV
jgi:ADP-dependent NAD(P)H-hydrate dehydratase / NAD(P)H-hydrate epimerase